MEDQKYTVTGYIRNVVEGALLGGSVTGILTPLLKWTNCQMNKTSMDWSRPFTGAPSYMASIAPTTAVMFVTYEVAIQILTFKKPKTTTESQEAIASTFAGMMAGTTRVLPEAIAQNQQLSAAAAMKLNLSPKPLSAFTVIQQAIKHNGVSSLGRGGLAIIGREGLYAQGYLFLTPQISFTINCYLNNQTTADLLAALISGSFVGILTTPFHRLRLEKQLDLTQPTKPLSYPTIIKNICQESQGSLLAQISNLFRGAKTRSVAVVAGTFFMYEGNEFLKKMRP